MFTLSDMQATLKPYPETTQAAKVLFLTTLLAQKETILVGTTYDCLKLWDEIIGASDHWTTMPVVNGKARQNIQLYNETK